METPKIKLLIPIEIKDGCELPEKDKKEPRISVQVIAIEQGLIWNNSFYNFTNGEWSSRTWTIYPSHWLKEVETDLTIDELKKIGVIK